MNQISPQLYEALNKAWKSTCKVILGEEIGELKAYHDWLSEYMQKIGRRKSHVSGKEVVLSMDDYCKGANYVSVDEVKEKAIAPLTINEIKDLDSIVEAIAGKWEYVGNKVLGNSAFVESSDSVLNSQYVANSNSVQDSQHIYTSSITTTNCKYIFGSIRMDASEFVIRCLRGAESKRHFETRFTASCSDSYVCSGCFDCQEIMFSFNLRNKNHCIGNLRLPKDRYQALKNKLIGEIREELKSNKSFPSLFELVPNKLPEKPADIAVKEKQAEFNKGAIEKAFQSTFKILFRRDPVGSIDDYGGWLGRHIGLLKEIDTPFGHGATVLSDRYYPIYSKIPLKLVVSANEALQLGDMHLDEEEIDSLESIRKSLPKIGYFADEMTPKGMCTNVTLVQGVADAMNIYNCGGAWKSENSAFTDQSVFSKHVFGGIHTSSQFCINCYGSTDLNRCFELESSRKCSDAYLCHNCEGLSEAMFCFNTKGKRHAIGNTELPPEQYRKIKDMLVGQMADEIIKNKGLKLDIFNVGCYKRK